MGKTGRATWFRIYLGQKAFIDGSDDAVVGQALKAALHYFSTGEIRTLDGVAHALFCSFRESVDETLADFEAKSKRNAENVKKRWGKKLPSDTTRIGGNAPLPSDTDKEGDSEEDTEGEGEKGSPAPASKNYSGDQRVYDHASKAYQIAKYLADEKAGDNPCRAQPTEAELQKQAAALEELHTQNGVAWDVMEEVMYQSLDHDYWQRQVQSAYDFKRYFNKILADVSDRG